MTKQAFKTADVLRLEVGAANLSGGLRNLLKNPTGERGAWGWITPPADVAISASYLSGSSSTDLDGTGSYLEFQASGPSGVIAYFTSEPEPCAPGQYAIAETRLKYSPPAGRAAEISLVFYDSAGAQISRAGVKAIPSGSAIDSVWRTTATVAPAGTARVAMRVDSLAGTNGSRTLRLDRNSLVVGADATALAAYSFVTPYTYTNVLLPAFEITTDRAGLTLGTLSARLRDASIDPSVNALIRPGAPLRLMARPADTNGNFYGTGYLPLFVGFVARASVTYDLAHPDPAKRALISITATDAADRLANLKQPSGVSTINDLRYLVEGCSVPWKISGTNNLTPGAATVTSRNDNASVLDQVAITRDTTLGIAFVDRYGVLVADTIAGYGTTLQGVLAEPDYRHDLSVDYDTARCINSVTVKRLTLDPTTPDFIGRPSTVETVFGPYVDRASVAAWGAYGEEFTVTGLSDSAVATLAGQILAANAVPKVRCNRLAIPITEARHFADGVLTVPPYNAAPYTSGSNNFGVQKRAFLVLYDRVTVLNTRANLTETLRVTGVKHAITPDKWIVDIAFASTSGVSMPSKAPDLGTVAEAFGDTAWTSMAIGGGWEAYPGSSTCRYRRRNGMVELRGAVRSQGVNGYQTIFFTLPPGFRPSTASNGVRGVGWTQPSSAGCGIYVYPTGGVTIYYGPGISGEHSLDLVTFEAEQ